MTWGQGACTIKLFRAVKNYIALQASVFVTFSLFLPGLIFFVKGGGGCKGLHPDQP